MSARGKNKLERVTCNFEVSQITALQIKDIRRVRGIEHNESGNRTNSVTAVVASCIEAYWALIEDGISIIGSGVSYELKNKELFCEEKVGLKNDFYPYVSNILSALANIEGTTKSNIIERAVNLMWFAEVKGATVLAPRDCRRDDIYKIEPLIVVAESFENSDCRKERN